MRFIDLFAGLGGFHIALSELGHECVFACEVNEDLRKLYETNFNIKCKGDINAINIEEIPKHEILCAGFPCQPFSKAGKQNGLNDPDNGNFFNKIMEIVDAYDPEYVFLENVPNLKGHDGGNTWNYIYSKLSIKYDVREDIISPHIFGIPQHRSRFYIVSRLWTKGGLDGFKFPKGEFKGQLSIETIIENDPEEYTELKQETIYQLKIWQEFLDHLKSEEVPRFPVWSMEFGATYPFEEQSPITIPFEELKKYKGKFGQKIKGHSLDEVLECLPNYSRTDIDEFPGWKKYYIRANREFYLKHNKWLDKWIPKVIGFENSHQKLEWNCGDKIPLNINDKIIQFRPSGIRVKMPNFSPALVLTSTQIPLFPWLGRYMTKKEAAKLQCMDSLKEFPKTTAKAFRAFGNAVNVCVVKQIAINLFDLHE
jgi:DNA (cytosine-5)-methyltransferase 1